MTIQFLRREHFAGEMHKLENEKKSIRFDRGQVFTIADNDLGHADLAGTAQGLVQQSVSLLATLLWLQKIRLIKKFRIDLLQLHKVGDIDGMGGFNPYFFKIFIFQNDVAPTLVFEAFDDLIGGDFFQIGFGHLLVPDWAKVSRAQLAET